MYNPEPTKVKISRSKMIIGIVSILSLESAAFPRILDINDCIISFLHY